MNKRNRIRTVALLVGSTLVAVLVAELLVRLSGLAPGLALLEIEGFRFSHNPLLGYEPVPDKCGKNSLGFRDREHMPDKPEGVYRIIVLGDSITEGIGVQAPEAFTVELERLLGLGDRPVEVLNFGVSGYNTQQEVELYRQRGLGLDADLLVLAYCLNDDELVSSELSRLVRARNQNWRIFGRRTAGLVYYSHLYRLVRGRLVEQELPASATTDPAVYPGEYNYLALDTVSEYLRVLAALAREGGQDVLVVVFPLFGDAESTWSADSRPYLADYRHLARHDLLRRLAQSNGFQFLDLLPAFRQCSEETEEPLSIDIYHPSAVGHRCAAARIARFLQPMFRGREQRDN